MSRKQRFNPFYALVVLVGIAFVVTTLAYVVAWVRLAQPDSATELGPMLQLVNDRGEILMIGEAVSLAVVAVLAMGVDQWQTRCAAADQVNSDKQAPAAEPRMPERS